MCEMVPIPRVVANLLLEIACIDLYSSPPYSPVVILHASMETCTVCLILYCIAVPILQVLLTCAYSIFRPLLQLQKRK